MANTLLEQRRGQMFPKLTAAQLARLERQGTRLQTHAGEILVELGDVPRGVFVVAAGSVEALAPPSATQAESTYELLYLLTPGDSTGEMAVRRDRGPRRAVSPARAEQCLQETARAPREFNETVVDEFDSQSARRPTGAITQVLEERTTQPRKTFDEALDALQLLTVTDVCKLLRISKPTLWRLRRSGDFPDPTTVTERIFGWRRSEIDAWLASRPSSKRY